MPVRGAATGDVAISEGDHLFTQEGNYPLYWSGKSNFQITPAHRLGKGYVSYEVGKGTTQEFSGRGAGFVAADHQILTSAGLLHLKFFRPHPLGFGKPKSGLGGVARLVKGHILGRTGDFNSLSRLFFSHIFDHPDQPSWGSHGSDGPVVNPLRQEEFADHRSHGIQSWLDVAGWDFLGADL